MRTVGPLEKRYYELARRHSDLLQYAKDDVPTPIALTRELTGLMRDMRRRWLQK